MMRASSRWSRIKLDSLVTVVTASRLMQLTKPAIRESMSGPLLAGTLRYFPFLALETHTLEAGYGNWSSRPLAGSSAFWNRVERTTPDLAVRRR